MSLVRVNGVHHWAHVIARLTYRGAVLPGLGFWASIAIL